VVNADISTVADKIAVEDSSSVKGNNTEGKAALALTLVSQTVSYSSTTLSIAFEFSDVLTPPVPTVTEDSSTTWTLVLSNENKTVTATYSGSSGPVTLGFTAVSNADSNKTVAVSTSAYAVESSAFSRSAATYQVVYYGEVAGSGSTTYAIAGLTNANSTKYYLLPTNDSGYFKNLFSAIYTPNAPGSTDSIEASKKAIAYDATVSAAALSLFHVTLDGSESSKDKVELKGATLPTASGASASNLIVIDIGLPDGTTNALPTFYIPAVTTSGPNTDNFGTSGQEYAYLRLRVNKGANLVILADNTAYAGNGAGNGTTNGYFANGCVEVMAGGKLRDGAYEGFPLGANAVILNRAGSYLSVGPEPDDTYATGNYLTTYEAYYKGYLIGPDGDPRIVWDSGNTGYLEVRPGELAISGNVTVKKLLGLIYSAYFIGNTTVTIDTTGDLFPNGDSYKFYGTDTYAKIVVKPNGKIDKGFFTSGATDVGTKLTAQTGSVTIQNTGTGGANGTYTSSISGTQNWADLADLTEAQ
jgi:hypothetical protein